MNDRGGYEWGSGGVAVPHVAPVVKRLIIVNVAVFIVQVLLARRFSLRDYLGVRADLVVERLWVWQVFTYMFLHDPVHWVHILMNMLCLHWFGTDLAYVLGQRRFLVIYLGGGILGGIAYCVTQYLVDVRIPAIGASGAVMAVMVVYAIYFPSRIILLFFLIPMTVKWAVLLLIGIDLLYSINTYADGVAHTAHLGGALFGYLSWRFGGKLEQFFDRIEDRQREREAERRADDERRMDEILAKINREGFDSLTRREREFLQEQSRQRRERGYRS